VCWHPPQPTWVGSYSGGGFCLRSPSATAAAFSCSQLVAQVLFPCAAAQHDAVPPQENSEVQGHAHSHSKHSDTPRAQAQRPACYYSCSEGGVIKRDHVNSSRTCSNRVSSHSFPYSSHRYRFQTCQRSTAVVSRAISLHCMCTMLSGECLFLLAEQASLFLLGGQRSSLYTCWQTSASFCVLFSSCLLLVRDCVFFLGIKREFFFACPQANG